MLLAHRVPAMAWIYQFFPVHRFPETCMSVYFSDDYNEADFILVNAGLQVLYWTYAVMLQSDEMEDYKRYSRMCAVNLETALANLPLHLPATSDHILALLAGVSVRVSSYSWV